MHKPYFKNSKNRLAFQKNDVYTDENLIKYESHMQNGKDADFLSIRSGADCFQNWEKCWFHAAKRTLNSPFISHWSYSRLPSSRQELHRAATGRHSQILQFAFSLFISEQPVWRIWLKDIFSFVPAEDMKKLFSD